MTCYFPPENVVEERLLLLLNAHPEPLKMGTIYRTLADQAGLTRYERRGVRGDPKGSAWEYLVRRARSNLVCRGWIHSPEIGRWALSEVGREEVRRRGKVGSAQPIAVPTLDARLKYAE